MKSIEDFKSFIKTKPELISYIKEHNDSIQKLYEVYDIYGEDDKVWDEYTNSNRSNINLNNIKDIVKNIDIDSIKGHINTAQKAIGIVQELTSKAEKVGTVIKKPISPKPLGKFFED